MIDTKPLFAAQNNICLGCYVYDGMLSNRILWFKLDEWILAQGEQPISVHPLCDFLPKFSEHLKWTDPDEYKIPLVLYNNVIAAFTNESLQEYVETVMVTGKPVKIRNMKTPPIIKK